MYLAKRFLDIANIELPKSVKGFSPSAIEAMLAYRWPGNVRQLRSVVRRAVLMAEDVVTEEHLGLRSEGLTSPRDNRLAPSSAPFRGMCDLSLRETVRSNTVHVERIAIVHALRRTGGNKAKAARLLQVDYKTLHSKVKEYGIFRLKENNYMVKKHNEKTSEAAVDLGLGGILKGFGDLVEKLGELAKTGDQLSRTGEIHGPDKEVKGIYGFTVKVGSGRRPAAGRAVRQHPQGP